MDIIGSITSAIDIVRKAKALADELKNLEMKTLIVDLQSDLLDLKTECLRLREENNHLMAENARLSAPPELVPKHGVYYRKSDDDGPFCTGCHDTKKQMVRLSPTTRDLRIAAGYAWQCPSCRQRYAAPER